MPVSASPLPPLAIAGVPKGLIAVLSPSHSTLQAPLSTVHAFICLQILAAASGFKAETVDYSKESIIFRLAAEARRIDDVINLMRDYTILEICRSGSVSLEQGGTTIRQVITY